MGLIFADDFLYLLRVYRIVNITGKTGGFKTALAFRLSWDILETKFCRYLVSNVRNIWRSTAEEVIPDDHNRLNTVIVLDEGGLFLDDPTHAKAFQTALRKTNSVVFIPSVASPSNRLKAVTVWLSFQFYWCGLPLLVYQWVLRNAGTRDQGFFLWWGPEEIFGIYDTAHYPTGDSGLAAWFLQCASRFDDDSYSYFSNDGEKSSAVSNDFQSDNMGAVLGALQELSDTISDDTDILKQAADRVRFKRRK